MPPASYHAAPYRKTLTARVFACRPEPGGGYAVVLADTLLRPAGGGQPADRGWLDGHPVRGLEARADGRVSHRVDAPLSGAVQVELDWPRRYDHMQQHTAQHLLTAIAGAELGLRTTAFHLGEAHSDLELDIPALDAGLAADLQQRVNAAVRRGLPVRSGWVDEETYRRLEVRSRLLPAGLSGPYRLVEIEGLDRNTCTGTHVASTAEVQAVVLADSEQLRGGTRVFFLAGGRVLDALDERLERERSLNRLLSCGPPDHPAAIERLQAEVRAARQRARARRQELADQLGAGLAAGPFPAALHRPDDDMAMLQAVARAMLERRPDGLALLTAGRGSGVFVLAGPAERVARLGPRVAEQLDGRGGGAGALYQGKVAALDRRRAALELLRCGGLDD